VVEAVADLGLALIRVEPRRASLEDLFNDSDKVDRGDDEAAA